MRKITRLLATAALMFGVVGGAKAIKTLGTEFTSVGALDGKTFAIVNKTDGKAICHKQKNAPYDLQYLAYADAFSDSNFGYTFKIESTDDGYFVRCVDPSGNLYDNDYLQSNSSESGSCFIFAKNFGETNRGLDGDGYAVWVIEYVADEGFTLKNLATDKYINDPTKAAYSDTPKYFTFCELEELTTTISINNVSITETLASNPEHFTEITQENVEGSFTHADKEEGATYTTYTTKEGNAGQLNIAIKTLDVDVDGCDFVLINFAEGVPEGWYVAFWSDQTNVAVPTSANEYKLIFSEDTYKEKGVKNGVLPQITLMTMWARGPIVAKVEGIYKHTAIDYNRTYSFDQALDFTDTGIEAYVITSFDADKGTLTLSRVNQVPANTGLYLVGKGGDYNIPTLESADPIATNLLKPSGDGTITKISGDYTNLVLAGSGDNRGFHPLSADGNMGANKAYLQLSTTDYNSIAGARLKMVFEDEATAIKTVKVAEVEKGIFNLAGQRLAKAQKGLNIINGKKVLVK